VNLLASVEGEGRQRRSCLADPCLHSIGPAADATKGPRMNRVHVLFSFILHPDLDFPTN
jgi:hypothetical protein